MDKKIFEEKKARRADGPACILSFGRANPPNIMYHKDYPDYYFRVTNSEHMVELKEKFKLICEKTKIKKRHLYLTEEILKANPNMLTFGAPSLSARHAMTVDYTPKLGTEAAVKAIEEWGQPKSKITHLIVSTTLALNQPGVDRDIATFLELDSSVQRTAFYLVGCHAGPHTLRHAMNIAESDKNARILIVYTELTTVNFHGPSADHIDSLIGQALFGDGAVALIVGADPDTSIEKPLFELMHGHQTTVYDTRGSGSKVIEMGQTVILPKDLPMFVSKSVEGCLVKALEPTGITDRNSLFWIPHNGGPKVLDMIEAELGLDKDKFEVTRHVLSEYGHMGGVGVIFMLDEMRRRSMEEGKTTTGLGFEWGVMFGFGPGLTIETLILRSVPLI